MDLLCSRVIPSIKTGIAPHEGEGITGTLIAQVRITLHAISILTAVKLKKARKLSKHRKHRKHRKHHKIRLQILYRRPSCSKISSSESSQKQLQLLSRAKRATSNPNGAIIGTADHTDHRGEGTGWLPIVTQATARAAAQAVTMVKMVSAAAVVAPMAVRHQPA